MTIDIKTWYKQTKIGIIPNDWDISFLDDEKIDILYWYAFESEKFNTESLWMPIIRIRDLLDSSISTYFNWEYDNKYIVKQWDMLVWMDWEFNVILRNNIDALLNQRICKIESKWNKIKQWLLYYILLGQLKKIEEKTSFTTVKHLSGKDIRKIEIPIPNNPTEQSKIADILSSVDELIEKTDKIIDIQKKLKEGLLSKLMREGKNIKTNKLKNIAKFSQWIQVDLEQQKTHHSEWYMRFLRIVDYTQETKDLRYIIFPWERYVANEDDVVMVRYWASAWFIGTGKKWVIANNMFKVEPNWDVLKKYLYFFLKQNKIGKLITQMSTASAMPQLNFTMVGSIEITYPEDIKDQEKIIDILTTVDNSIIDEEHYKDLLKILKKWLMDKLLVGEIRVKL